MSDYLRSPQSTQRTEREANKIFLGVLSVLCGKNSPIAHAHHKSSASCLDICPLTSTENNYKQIGIVCGVRTHAIPRKGFLRSKAHGSMVILLYVLHH